MISGLSVPVLGLIDTAIVGRVGTPAALGAVALGSWLFDLLYWSFGFLRMGTTGLISQARGRGDLESMRPLLARPLFIGLIGGIVVITLGDIASPYILSFMVGADSLSSADREQAQLTMIGVSYFRARVCGGPAVLMNYALLGWLLGMGRAKSALWMQLSLNTLNTLLSVWWGNLYGVVGIGAASAASQWITCAYWGHRIWWRYCPPLPWISFKRAMKDKVAWLTLLSLNFHLWVRTCLLLTSFGLINALSARFGPLTLSANALLLHLQSLQSFTLDGFAHGAEVIVGERLGAKNLHGYRESLRAGMELTMGAAAVISLIYFLGGAQVLRLLTHHSSVIDEALMYLPWAIFSPLASAPCFLLDGVMIGAVASGRMMRGMIISSVGLIIALCLLLPIYGNHGLWMSFLLFMLIRSITLAPLAIKLGK